ncbi:HIT family protein [Nocardioides pantholopis]|uniref:HIT family protein n=1 Tax=Nocardioides pantholopis TaxID=2483798 RepID=UPI000FD98104|nr:HIT domain-containing protein [Nocardioides pantholopis]
MPTSDADCPFCAIVRGRDSDAREVYRDDFVIAFFPTEPATLGHTLLVPRQHVGFIWHLSDELAAVLGQATTRLARAVHAAVEPDGLNVIQSNGEAATQTVPHLHIHLVPRWDNDNIGPIWPSETDYTEDQKDRAWSAIRDECRTLMS